MSKVLKCRLVRAIVTDKLHFIPTGTPVEILRWADNSKNPHVPDDELKVRVRVDAYMYLGIEDEDENHPNVDSGLIVEIQTSNLDFMSYEQLPTKQPDFVLLPL